MHKFNDWVLIFSSSSPIEAEITKSMLLENDIETVELNKKDSSYQAFGVVELYCKPNDVIAALQLINTNKI
jgi:hypothetical protein